MTKILIVEDSPSLLENTSLELEFRGYEVIQATDGQSAVNILRTSEDLPDVIVSDIAMPDMDGYALLEHVRSEPKWRGLPVLFITAFDNKNAIQISRELGVDDYLVKPFEIDELVVAIENKLKRIEAFKHSADENLDDARRTLLHMLAHELRTPLTTIYGGTEFLISSLVNAPDQTVNNVVHLIQRGANRLNRLTGKALVLLQIDSGDLKKSFKESQRQYSVEEVVETAIATIQNEIIVDKRNTTIEITGSTQALFVNGIFIYLVMMVEEPLRNAVAASSIGSKVEVTINQADDQVSITIQDHGYGIPEAHLERVWNRFIQIDRDQHEQQGVGLGLSITREIAHIHGGDCVISSQIGKGTTVTLSLPKADFNGY